MKTIEDQQHYKNQIEKMKLLIKAAKHLILAAKGPTDGPTNWDETRNRWIKLAEEIENENC